MPVRVRQWAAAEVSAGRLFPWLAVSFGFGVVLYFTAEHEPMWQAAVPLAAACAVLAVLLRRRFVAHVLALGLFAISAGFAVATVRTALIDHPVLRYPGIMAQTPQTR